MFLSQLNLKHAVQDPNSVLGLIKHKSPLENAFSAIAVAYGVLSFPAVQGKLRTLSEKRISFLPIHRAWTTAGRHNGHEPRFDAGTVNGFIRFTPRTTYGLEQHMANNIYFIGGGNMVTAIIAALRRKAEAFPVDHLYVEEVSPERTRFLEDTYSVIPASPGSAPDANIVLIGIRPQDDVAGVARSVAERFSPESTTVVSIVAGYTLAKLQKSLGDGFPILRIIPNTLTTVEYGYTGAAPNAYVKKENVDAFLRTFGKVLYVDEKLIDVITGFYPPNIVYHFVDAYIDAGVLAGLPRDIAKAIALDTIVGGVALLQQRDVLPQVLLNINNSPGGVGLTEAYTLNRTGFAASIQSTVLAAVEKTTVLGSHSN